MFILETILEMKNSRKLLIREMKILGSSKIKNTRKFRLL